MELEKEIICIEAVNLNREQRIEVLNCIKEYDPKYIQKFPDGSRIDLNLLPEAVIKTIHTKISYLLNLN